jgi:hypothetical protein
MERTARRAPESPTIGDFAPAEDAALWSLAGATSGSQPAAALRHVTGSPGLGLLRRLRPLPAPSADGGPAHRRPGRPAGRATLGGFPRSPCTGWRGGAQLFPCSLATGTPQTFPVAFGPADATPTTKSRINKVMACAAGRPTSARLEPVHSLEGVRPLVHVVLHLPALLAGPGPSGGAGPSRRCRGRSCPPQRLQGQAAPSFTGLLRQAGGGLLQPTRLHGASRRTASSMQSAPASIEWTRANSLRPGWAAPGRSPRSMSASAACSMPSRSASVAGSSRPALAMAWVS